MAGLHAKSEVKATSGSAQRCLQFLSASLDFLFRELGQVSHFFRVLRLKISLLLLGVFQSGQEEARIE